MRGKSRWSGIANSILGSDGNSCMLSTDSAKGCCVKQTAKSGGLIGFLAASTLLALGCSSQKVTFEISQDGLAAVQRAAPSSEYALFVSSRRIPKTARDLENYGITDCTGELMQVAVSLNEAAGGSFHSNPLTQTRIYQLMAGIRQGIGSSADIQLVGCGKNQEGIKSLLEEKQLIGVARREKGAPKGAVEIAFK